MRFETERMMVRSFQEGDLPDLQEILGDAQTMVYMEPPYTLEQTARFLQDFCIGRKGALAAEDKASGRVIGYLLCNEIQDDIYEIGWIFNRRIWRQGYAYSVGFENNLYFSKAFRKQKGESPSEYRKSRVRKI